MRKINAIISIIIIILFIVHGILGGFQMMGAGTPVVKWLSWIFAFLVLVHIVLGVIFTVKTIRIQRSTGAYYFKENKLFWLRRISGFAIIILMAFHVTAFSYNINNALRLHEFTLLRLLTQILLLAAVCIHVISNIKPLMLSLGVRSHKKVIVDILIIISILIIFMAIAFIVYYLRWNVF